MCCRSHDGGLHPRIRHRGLERPVFGCSAVRAVARFGCLVDGRHDDRVVDERAGLTVAKRDSTRISSDRARRGPQQGAKRLPRRLATQVPEGNVDGRHRGGEDAAGTGATPAKPFLQSHNIIDAPKWYERNSTGLKLDWRVTPKSVLSVGFQATYYIDTNGNVNRTTSVGTAATSTLAGGVPLTFSDTLAHSATGRGTSVYAANLLHIDARTLGSNARWRWQNAGWTTDLNGFASTSKTWARDVSKGHFNTIGTAQPADRQICSRRVRWMRWMAMSGIAWWLKALIVNTVPRTSPAFPIRHPWRKGHCPTARRPWAR